MSCAIVAIGNELVSGRVVNSNAAWISQQLYKEGYQITEHLTLPDEQDLMEQGINSALSQNNIVIVTGGLGPTCDDLTRPIVAKLLGRPIVQSPELLQELRTRYQNLPISIEDQACVIEGALLLKNRLGTAPGMYIRLSEAILVLLPGVPYEMQAIVTDELLPLLKKEHAPKKGISSHFLHTYHLSESHVDTFLRQVQEMYPQVTCGIYPAANIITVQLSAFNADPKALHSLELALEFLRSQIGKHWFEAISGTPEEAILTILKLSGKTISYAESCTGGALAARLTRLPGASKVFLGGVVAYHNAIKEQILGVRATTLSQHGAVSEQVVKEMAEGILKLTDSGYSLAVSGIAGPDGGTPDKPVGTVWGAVGRKDGQTHTKLFMLRGNREGIIVRACNALMGEFLLSLKD